MGNDLEAGPIVTRTGLLDESWAHPWDHGEISDAIDAAEAVLRACEVWRPGEEPLVPQLTIGGT